METNFIDEFIQYCLKHNISYTVNNNPTEDEIKRIKQRIERNKIIHAAVAKLVKAPV